MATVGAGRFSCDLVGGGADDGGHAIASRLVEQVPSDDGGVILLTNMSQNSSVSRPFGFETDSATVKSCCVSCHAPE